MYLYKTLLAVGTIGMSSVLAQTESCVANIQVFLQSGSDDSNANGTDGDNGDILLLQADLTGEGGGSGRARYEERTDRTDFDVEIESGEPGTTLDIIIDGIIVDQITLDDTGFGEIEYRDPPDDDPEPHEFPFPDNFPPIEEGTVVEVGGLTGVMTIVVDDDSEGDDDGDDDEDREDDADDDAETGDDSDEAENGAPSATLTALLVGEGGGSGRARYEERTDRTEFDVEIESGEPGATVDIIIDGVIVDQLTLDDTGFGEIEYRDPPDDDPEPHEFPFPDNFPPIEEGTIVEVGGLSGTLAPALEQDQ